MKKLFTKILSLLVFTFFLFQVQAQVNNLPAIKSATSYNGTEKNNRIIEPVSEPILMKSKSQESLSSERGNKNNNQLSNSRKIILSNHTANDIANLHLPNSSLKSSATTCDTFVNYTAYDSLTYYSYHYTQNGKSKFGGYFSGNNHYKDKAKAEFFNINYPGAQLSTVYLLFGKATYASSTTSKVNIKVWDNTGTNGGPGAVLGTQSVKIKDIATDVTNYDFTDVTFTNPITVNTPFYVGVELSLTTGDTVVLYSTTIYNQNSNTAFEQWSDNSWAAYDTSWGYSLNHFVAAALCVNSTVDAEFAANKTSVSVGESIDFTDLSTGNPSSWSWSFTGAVPYASTQQNPTVTYYTPGTYEVSLTVSDGFANDTETKTAYITVSASSSSSCDTLHNVDFTNDSLAIYLNTSTSYPGGYWSGHNGWGDLALAEYFYGYPSGYELTSVMLGFGVAEYSSSTSKIKVRVWDNTGSNGAPGKVLASKNVKISQIANDVANGQYTTVTFTTPVAITTPYYIGIELTYASGDTVALYTNTVYNGKPNTAWTYLSDSTWAAFDDSNVNWGYNLSLLVLPIMCPVVTGSAPDAAFTANATTVYVGGNVDFTDLSTNSPTSWAWAFSGGTPTSSTVQNPSGVVYNTVGVYEVSLTASNSYGSDTETKTAYITVLDTTTTTADTTDAEFTANVTTIAVGSSVDFTDLSSGYPTSWSWTFNGGSPSSSTAQNPNGIVYNTAGTYTVSLTASGPNGTDTETKTNYINVVVAPIICDTLMNVDLVQDTPIYVNLAYYGYVGYISGHNEFYDEAKAEYFSSYTPGAELTGGLFWFGVAEYSSTTSKVTFKVWDNTGTNGTPGNVLASETMTIAQIATDIANYEFTEVNFTNPPTINTPFYLGVEFTYNAGDTIALVHNMPGETVPSTAWELWNTQDWYSYGDSWGWDVAHYIFPSLCYQGTITTVSNAIGENNILIYPNPNTGSFQLYTAFQQSGSMKVSIMNALGEVVYSTTYNGTITGNYEIDLSKQPNGVYSIKVETEANSFSKQIVISK